MFIKMKSNNSMDGVTLNRSGADASYRVTTPSTEFPMFLKGGVLQRRDFYYREDLLTVTPCGQDLNPSSHFSFHISL